jgi:hypothetical protein
MVEAEAEVVVGAVVVGSVEEVGGGIDVSLTKPRVTYDRFTILYYLCNYATIQRQTPTARARPSLQLHKSVANHVMVTISA